MKVHANCQVKDEAILLEHVLPFWQEYPVDEFVFLNDNSADNTSEVIGDFLGDEATILSPVTDTFHEAKNRSTMLEYSRSKDADIEQCPFLVDEVNVAKLKKAKDNIIANMAEPPTLQELSEQIDLSLKKLKEGFKQIYGDTVYGFLFDYKMEVARKLLESGEHNVNEVGLKVGYSTSSHFIAAFKKKFGTTPKKYIQAAL